MNIFRKRKSNKEIFIVVGKQRVRLFGYYPFNYFFVNPKYNLTGIVNTTGIIEVVKLSSMKNINNVEALCEEGEKILDLYKKKVS